MHLLLPMPRSFFMFFFSPVFAFVILVNVPAQSQDLLATIESERVEPVFSAVVSVKELVALEASGKLVSKALREIPWQPLPVPSASGYDAEFMTESKSGSTGPPAPALGADFEALPQGSGIEPPDTHGAVGPNHLMVILNDRVGFQEKTGAVLETMKLDTFWSALGVSGVYDPKVVYDPHSGRFIAVACVSKRLDDSSMVLGVSETSDPTGNWYLWLFDGDSTDTKWVDFPGIGYTKDRITFTSNMFRISDNSFAGVNTWVVEKPSALDGGAVDSTLFFTTGLTGVFVPAETFDSAETTQYIINRNAPNFFGTGTLRLFTVTGPSGSPVFTIVPTLPFSSPGWNASLPPADQLNVVDEPDTYRGITTNDDRIMNAVVRNGSLWCTHSVATFASPESVHVRWWEINPATGVTIQSGNIDDFDTLGRHYYYPAITVNANDEVLIAFSGSSSTEFASCYYTYRHSSMPQGEMNSVVMYKAGEDEYRGARWGDYSATCVDPSDDLTMWTIQEYAAADNKWSTWWGKLDAGSGAGTFYPAKPVAGMPVTRPVGIALLGGAMAILLFLRIVSKSSI